ncbi:hypothetical protein SK128_019240, partial [Halocaridina rubra]
SWTTMFYNKKKKNGQVSWSPSRFLPKYDSGRRKRGTIEKRIHKFLLYIKYSMLLQASNVEPDKKNARFLSLTYKL